MSARSLVLALLLAACGKSDVPPPKRDNVKPPPPADRPHKLEKLEMVVPQGWTSKYDADWDKWLFETPTADGRTANARIERAPDRFVASPDAYLQYRLKLWDLGTKATIEKREGVKDGFAMTVVVTAAADPTHPKRETYVVRQLGSVWYQCLSESIPDDAFRDELVGLCKSLKL
jgi:hypothetical protein